MARIAVLGAAMTLIYLGPSHEAAYAAGPAPFAFVSILEGRDVIGCGLREAPCRTAQFTETYVVRPGGAIYVDDVGRFGPPSVFTALAIAVEKIAGGPR